MQATGHRGWKRWSWPIAAGVVVLVGLVLVVRPWEGDQGGQPPLRRDAAAHPHDAAEQGAAVAEPAVERAARTPWEREGAPKDGSIRVLIPPPRDVPASAHPPLRVRVWTASGLPAAGAHLILRSGKKRQDKDQPWAEAGADAGADGVAVFPGVGLEWLGWSLDPDKRDPRYHLRVLAWPDLAAPPSVTLPDTYDFKDPVDFTLPPCGWIELSIEYESEDDRRDIPVRSLRWRAFDGAEALVDGRWGPLDPGENKALLGPIGVGWTVRAEIVDPRIQVVKGVDTTEPRREPIPGPTRDGEVVPAVLVVPALTVIQGNLLDHRGAPLTDMPKFGFVFADGQPWWGCEPRTMDPSNFRIYFWRGIQVDRMMVLVDEQTPKEQRVEVDIRQFQTMAPRIDVGEIRLKPVGWALVAGDRGPLLLAEGAVVDERGMPLKLVRVSATEKAPSHRPTVADYRTAADGRFRLEGIIGANQNEVELHASGKTHFLETPLTCAVGSQGIRLVLVRGGTLRGRIQMDGDDPLLLAAIVVEIAGGKELIRGGGSTELFQCMEGTPGAGEVSFVWGEPVVGVATLQLKLAETSWVLAERAGVEVRPGQDVDVGMLDLRGRVQTLHLALEDEAGEQVQMGGGMIVRDGDGKSLPFAEVEPGKWAGVVPSEVGEVQVSMPGYEDAVVRVASAPVRVVMRRR